MSTRAATTPSLPAPGNNLLLRGLAVLRCFGAERRALGSSDIARLTGLAQPTVWRICKTLESQGYLTLEEDGARYRPGPAVLTLGYAALESLDLAALCKPALQDLANGARGATGLSVRERHAMLLVQRCVAHGAVITYNMRTGDTLPMLTSASGWAHLATMASDARADLIAELDRTDPVAAKAASRPMKAAFDAFARSGYIVNVGMLIPGLISVAVPFESRRRGGAYVVSCSATTSVFGTRAQHEAVGEKMLHIARELAEV